jgi:hypothetical protein
MDDGFRQEQSDLNTITFKTVTKAPQVSGRLNRIPTVTLDGLCRT